MIKLRDDEKPILIKRRHIFVLFIEIFFVFFIFLVLIFAIVYFIFYPIPFSGGFETLGYSVDGFDLKYSVLFGMTLLLLILWQFMFISLADYYLDCWIITNERTIHTELKGIFNRFYSSVPNDRIQDITVDVKGFLPTVLQYGDLHIQTAGAFKDFVFRQVPKPYQAKDILLDVIRGVGQEDGKNKSNFSDKYEQWS